MLRIAHISDLHIRSADISNDDRTLLQEIAAFLLKKFQITVTAGGHDQNKLVALQNRLAGLRPSLIVVTGDLTNFGDRSSFKEAAEFIRNLKSVTRAEKVICIPGNHDCLVERLALAKQQAGWIGRQALRVAGLFSSEVGAMESGAKRQFAATEWKEEVLVRLFRNFEEHFPAAEFGRCDPAVPCLVDAEWGQAALFLFNSANEPGLMANKGNIGVAQYNCFNRLAQDPGRWSELEKMVRVALLHHHPISAPDAIDSDVERFYDWMDDGPRFLWRLNKRGFHLVLHGHQHVPFNCSVNYHESRNTDVLPTHIVAAGSASQAGDKPANSFNIIDLVSPFQAVLTRYDFDGTGFGDDPAVERVLELQPIGRVRVSPPDKPETVADWAVRQLLLGSGREYLDLGESYEYKELEFDARISRDQTYTGSYRRKGTVVSKRGIEGPIFVITGSPAVTVGAMGLQGIDNLTGDGGLACEVVKDEPNRKIIRVKLRVFARIGDAIDVTLRFQWQATATEPNDFDAVNLTVFRNRAQLVKYRVCLPWRPQQAGVRSIGLTTETVYPPRTTGPAHLANGTWEYGFELDNPAPLTYVIEFPE